MTAASEITSSAGPWTVRAVQLDLARQRETPAEIARFARFAVDSGYNTLLLYLEGVIRTASFDDRPASESYGAEQMAAIVADATTAGLSVVPCVNTLAHAEHFLNCPRLAPLGVEADGFGGPMFNPSDERTFEFLERYLAEIAPIFPDQNFHIGCDEPWLLNAGPQARARLAGGKHLPIC